MRAAGHWATLLPVGGALIAAVLLSASTEPAVRVAPMDSVGPRTMEAQTQASVIRDYLMAWQTMNATLTQTGRTCWMQCLSEKRKRSSARLFTSSCASELRQATCPSRTTSALCFIRRKELSIQLLDEVEYDVNVWKGEQFLGLEHVRARYVAVLSPSETRWKVRMFQGGQP